MLIKKPPPNKSEKPSEEKPSRSTPIKEVTQINSRELLTPTKHSPILKKDNCMINTDRKEFKTVVHLGEVVDLVIFSVSLVAEVQDSRDLKKPNQSLFKLKLHSMMFMLAA